MCKLSQRTAEHVKHVRNHMVNIQIAITLPVDCLIALKFGTEFDNGTAGITQMFKVKGQRYRESTLPRNVSAVEMRRSETATDRRHERLQTATKLKRIGTARRRAASSCNAFAIAMFSS